MPYKGGKINGKKRLKTGRTLAEISKDHKYNIQHVETPVIGHHKQFKHPITSQSLVNYLQCMCRALHVIFYRMNRQW